MARNALEWCSILANGFRVVKGFCEKGGCMTERTIFFYQDNLGSAIHIKGIGPLNRKMLCAIRGFLSLEGMLLVEPEGEPGTQPRNSSSRSAAAQKPKKKSSKGKSKFDAIADVVANRYRNGESTTDLAAAYGASDESIRSILQRQGVELRSLSEAVKLAYKRRRESEKAARPQAEIARAKESLGLKDDETLCCRCGERPVLGGGLMCASCRRESAQNQAVPMS